jgi:nicotinamide-nucleotide adenylyltransferase
LSKSALFIGRFQPFHLGHLDGLKQILANREISQVIIAIGSAETDFTPQNPLTTSERWQLIAATLEENQIKKDQYTITAVRDIHRYSLWPHHLIKLLPPFDFVFSGSQLVRMLFQKHTTKKVQELKVNYNLSATQIRNSLLAGKSISKHVSKKTLNLLESWEISDRLRMINV